VWHRGTPPHCFCILPPGRVHCYSHFREQTMFRICQGFLVLCSYMAIHLPFLAKLGLMGTTVFHSSGDNGVAGNGGVCLNAQRLFFLFCLFPLYHRGRSLQINPLRMAMSSIQVSQCVQLVFDCELHSSKYIFLGFLPLHYRGRSHTGKPRINGQRPGGCMRAGHLLWRRLLQHLPVGI